MSPTISQTKTGVQFGTPVDDIPGYGTPRKQFASHWMAVADECRRHTGQWVPVRVGHLTVDRHQQVPGDIKKGALGAFRDGQWDAAFRAGQLYIKHVTPAATALKAV